MLDIPKKNESDDRKEPRLPQIGTGTTGKP
jgi:hypothetical protein